MEINKIEATKDLALFNDVFNGLNPIMVASVIEKINHIQDSDKGEIEKLVELKAIKESYASLFKKIKDLKKILKTLKDGFLGGIEKETIIKIDDFIKGMKPKTEMRIELVCKKCGSTDIEKWSVKS